MVLFLRGGGTPLHKLYALWQYWSVKLSFGKTLILGEIYPFQIVLETDLILF